MDGSGQSESLENGICDGLQLTKTVNKSCNSLLKDFVWFFAEFQVKPAELAIVSTNDKMIPRWMHVHGGYPSDARQKRFYELLLGEVIQANVLLSLIKGWSAVGKRISERKTVITATKK